MKSFLGALLAPVMLLASAPAHAENVGFTFYPGRFIGGEVTGTIYDIDPNGTSTPDRILFDWMVPPNPYSIYAGAVDLHGSDISGFVTTAGGLPTDVEFSGANADGSISFSDTTELYEVATHGLVGIYTGFYSVTEGGLGPTYFVYPAAAPEPSTWALLIAAVAGVGAALRFRRPRRRVVAAAI